MLRPLGLLAFCFLVATPAAAAPQEGWSGYDGGFVVETDDGDYRLRIGGRLQARFDIEVKPDVNTEIALSDARIQLTGNVFTKKLDYELGFGFDNGQVGLKDAFFDATLVSKWLTVRIGQFKQPFWRQFLNGDGSLALSARANTSDAVGAVRDVGIAFHNRYNKSPEFEYIVALVRGAGIDPIFDGRVANGRVTGGTFESPSDVHPTLIARAGYNYGELKGYKEGDLQGGPLRFGVAVAGLCDFGGEAGTAASRVLFGADGQLEWEGLEVTAAFFLSSTATDDFFGRVNNLNGTHVQVSYAFADFLAAARYSFLWPKFADDEHELTAAFSWLVFGHDGKLVLEHRVRLINGDAEHQTRLQAQIQL